MAHYKCLIIIISSSSSSSTNNSSSAVVVVVIVVVVVVVVIVIVVVIVVNNSRYTIFSSFTRPYYEAQTTDNSVYHFYSKQPNVLFITRYTAK